MSELHAHLCPYIVMYGLRLCPKVHLVWSNKLLRTVSDQAPGTRQKLFLRSTDGLLGSGTGMTFVQATYKLERDGCLVFKCYEISSVSAAVNMTQLHYPNLQAVTRQLSGGNLQVDQQLSDYTLSCVRPGLQYYEQCFTGCPSCCCTGVFPH